MTERVVFTPEAVTLAAALKAAWAPDFSPLGRVLRGQRANVFPSERLSRGRQRRLAGRDRRLSVLCRGGAIRLLVRLPDYRRRHEGGRRQFFAGSGRRHSICRALASFYRHGIRGFEGRTAAAS